MTNCIVCLDSLDTGPITALVCGHVFHHDCISPWVANRPQCPLCKKSITQHHHTPLIPLFLELTGQGKGLSGLQDTAALSSNAIPQDQFRDQCNQLRNQLQTTLQKLKSERQQFEKEKRHHANKLSAYQNIKGVLDLETRLSSRELNARMQDWKALPRDQLVIRLMALSERQQYLVTELESKQNQLDRSYQRIQQLKKRPKRTNSNRDGDTLDSSPRIKRRRSSPRTDDTSSVKKLDKQPAIDIDSGDDTADEDDALLITTLAPHGLHTSTYTQQNEQSSSSSGSGSSLQGRNVVDQVNVSEQTGPSFTRAQPSPSDEFVLTRGPLDDDSWQRLISQFVEPDDTDSMPIVWTATNPISKTTTRNAMPQHVIELSSDDDEPTRRD